MSLHPFAPSATALFSVIDSAGAAMVCGFCMPHRVSQHITAPLKKAADGVEIRGETSLNESLGKRRRKRRGKKKKKKKAKRKQKRRKGHREKTRENKKNENEKRRRLQTNPTGRANEIYRDTQAKAK